MAILTETAIRRAFIKAAEMAISGAMDDFRQKAVRATLVDKAIEKIIPKQYIGISRIRLKSRIKKCLKENYDV